MIRTETIPHLHLGRFPEILTNLLKSICWTVEVARSCNEIQNYPGRLDRDAVLDIIERADRNWR